MKKQPTWPILTLVYEFTDKETGVRHTEKARFEGSRREIFDRLRDYMTKLSMPYGRAKALGLIKHDEELKPSSGKDGH